MNCVGSDILQDDCDEICEFGAETSSGVVSISSSELFTCRLRREFVGKFLNLDFTDQDELLLGHILDFSRIL
uniref:Uncharacterized protein n=1 Tax=Schistosoma curassoni TaxID=6186 RepID=A0A183JHC1_9TREM